MHPKMAPYSYGVRNRRHLIDLVITRQYLREAQKFVARVRKNEKELLFVGTKSQAAQRIQTRAEASGRFFVRERWLGGILTNWATIRASLLQLHRLERDKKKGLWQTLQKKDATALQKRLERLERYLGGLKGIRSLPGAVIMVGQTVEIAAVQECRKLGIPLICRLDTDCNPDLVKIGVPINDDSVLRIRIFLKVLLLGIHEGRRWRFSGKVRKPGNHVASIDSGDNRIFEKCFLK
jgi:small subunit ribosomal protein S2